MAESTVHKGWLGHLGNSERGENINNRVHRERDHDGAVFSSSGVDVPREGGSRLEEDTVAKWKDSVQLFSKH